MLLILNFGRPTVMVNVLLETLPDLAWIEYVFTWLGKNSKTNPVWVIDLISSTNHSIGAFCEALWLRRALTVTIEVSPMNWFSELVLDNSIDVTLVKLWVEVDWLEVKELDELMATLQLEIINTNNKDSIDLNIFILNHLKTIIL